MVTGLPCTSMLLVASSDNLCLSIVKFYWNIKKIKCGSQEVMGAVYAYFLEILDTLE